MTERHGFDLKKPKVPRLPVLVSVPHAGRDYPACLAMMSRLKPEQWLPLEDRHADRLIERAVALGAPSLVARMPRLWIDLNRDEREVDSGMMAGAPSGPAIMTAKVRGGLGLVPRRIARGGDLWWDRLNWVDLQDRVETVHRPYHAALADQLQALRSQFGTAILLDVHSMPPVVNPHGEGAPQIVIGDRFGRSAHGRFTARALIEAESAGYATAVNAPYAGGYILERHGQPEYGIHALQLEIDRRLYLDTLLIAPGRGLAAIQRLVERLVLGLAEEAQAEPLLMAAE